MSNVVVTAPIVVVLAVLFVPILIAPAALVAPISIVPVVSAVTAPPSILRVAVPSVIETWLSLVIAIWPSPLPLLVADIVITLAPAALAVIVRFVVSLLSIFNTPESISNSWLPQFIVVLPLVAVRPNVPPAVIDALALESIVTVPASTSSVCPAKFIVVVLDVFVIANVLAEVIAIAPLLFTLRVTESKSRSAALLILISPLVVVFMSKLAPVTLILEPLLESIVKAPVTSMSKPLPPLISRSNPPVVIKLLPKNLIPSTVTCPCVELIVNPNAELPFVPVCVIVEADALPIIKLPISKSALAAPLLPNAVTVAPGSAVKSLNNLNVLSVASL